MKTYLIKTSEITYKFYRVEADSLQDAEKKVFTSKDRVNTLKTAQVIDSINEEIIEPLTKRFEVIDKKSHVITKDNMTSTYYSKPKN